MASNRFASLITIVRHWLGLERSTDAADAIVLEQYRLLKVRVQSFYVFFSANIVLLAVSELCNRPITPLLLVPFGVAAVGTVRILQLRKLWIDDRNVEEMRRFLRQVRMSTAFIACAISIWGVYVYQLPPATDVGIRTGGRLLIFASSTLVAANFLLKYLPSATRLMNLIIGGILGIFLLSRGDAGSVFAAANLFVVVGVTGSLVKREYAIFHKAVLQSEAVVALSNENLSLAMTDDLTGLQNRRSFISELNDIESASEPAAIALLDLDGFKPINDLFGHASGDIALQIVAQRLRTILGSEAVLARLGGDEFGIILRDEAAGDYARLMQAVLVAFGEPVTIKGTFVPLGVSIGLSGFDGGSTSASETLENADFALATAKAAGRGQIRVFTPEDSARRRAQSQLDVHLTNSGLVSDLQLVYQPLLNCDSGHLIGAEVLARW